MYIQSDTLLLADVLENFQNKCIEIYELNHAHFLSAPRLARQADFKKLEILTDIDMLLMVGLEEEYVMQYINMQKRIINI